MNWQLLRLFIEALTSFLLFHEFRRLLKVVILCRKHDIKCAHSFTLALVTITLSAFFLVSFSTDLEHFLSKHHPAPAKVDKKEDGQKTRRVYVEKVLNGDTIRLSNGERVVYKGIDAPEFYQGSGWMNKYSLAATELNKKLVEGKHVILQLDPVHRDKYKRIIAYVHADDVFVNAELVRQGMAMAVNYVPGGKYTPLLSRLQQEAMVSNQGIWKYALTHRDLQTKPVIGNRRSKIYHLPGGRYYNLVSPKNRVYFRTEEEARLAEYRKSRY